MRRAFVNDERSILNFVRGAMQLLRNTPRIRRINKNYLFVICAAHTAFLLTNMRKCWCNKVVVAEFVVLLTPAFIQKGARTVGTLTTIM